MSTPPMHQLAVVKKITVLQVEVDRIVVDGRSDPKDHFYVHAVNRVHKFLGIREFFLVPKKVLVFIGPSRVEVDCSHWYVVSLVIVNEL